MPVLEFNQKIVNEFGEISNTDKKISVTQESLEDIIALATDMVTNASFSSKISLKTLLKDCSVI